MIEARGELWGTVVDVAAATKLTVRTVRRYVAAGVVRRRAGFINVADVVAEEKARRDRRSAGVSREQEER